MNGSRILLLALCSVAAIATSIVFSVGNANAATTTIAVGDLFYCDSSFEGGVCTRSVNAGDTVVWDMSGANIAHTVTDCGASCSNPTSSPSFDSGIMESGTFSFTFATPGTYNYYCQVHAFEMRGTIVVQAAAAPTPTLVPGTTPTGGATPVPGTTPTGSTAGGLPPTGYGAEQQASSQWWTLAAMALIGIAMTSLGAFAYSRRR